MKTLSIIIPVYKDLPALKRVVGLINCWDEKPDEIIVVEPQDNSECELFCKQHGILHFGCEQKGRGAQLAFGAQQAKSDIYWFLHADSIPASNSIPQIKNAIESGARGGCFLFSFAGNDSIKANIFERIINFRMRIGVPYGDQGLFVTDSAYKNTSGFKPYPLFEEVEMVKQLKKTGNFRALKATIGVDCRKWQREGWYSRSITNRLLAIGYMLGVSPDYLARIYYKLR